VHAAAPIKKTTKDNPRRVGGRATAAGVAYESRIAASIAVTMLCGSKSTLWNGIGSDEIGAVTLQAREAVDDVVVALRCADGARAFISAKYRGNAIPITNASSAFVDTIRSFVTQFQTLPKEARSNFRFVWAIPSSAGAAATRYLPQALDAHREEAFDSPLSQFISSRTSNERRVFENLVERIKSTWAELVGSDPSEEELRELLRLVHVELYDFGGGLRSERIAERELRTHVLADASHAPKAWSTLEKIFERNDRNGLTVTPASLRRELTAAGIALALPPDYADDIERLRQLTERNLKLLNEHTSLPFGPCDTDRVHIDRTDELTSFLSASHSTDLLLTGEPGCGKSGLVHDTANELRKNGTPTVLLLAEEIASSVSGSGDFLGLDHSLVEVLENWPAASGGILLTDALDSVREPAAQREIRALLRDVRMANCNWKVIASVREFDLKHSRELRGVFPGTGVVDHESSDFSGVSHFHLRGLTDDQLDELGQRRPEIVPFLDSARANPKSGSLHKSPFYLRLATELLAAGVAPARVADWNSPALLLRKFWENRVEGDDAETRVAAIVAICRRMVEQRAMVVAAQEVSFDASGLRAINDLRSRGILQSPSLLHGDNVGAETIRFSHHLLHDYAIARAYIPTVPERFCNFVRGETLLPIFYRQSFVFALEEIWDADQTRTNFWATTLDLEGTATLHGLSRILGPLIAARRVERLDDLQPLLEAIVASADNADPPQKALRHVAAGLQDTPAELILSGAPAWCEFVQQLSALIVSKPFLEAPVTHILARLDAVGANR
jgi:hypothetical protein